MVSKKNLPWFTQPGNTNQMNDTVLYLPGERTDLSNDVASQVGQDTGEDCAFCTEDSSSAALQILPYVANSTVPASNTSLEPRLGISREINEHIRACCKMAKILLEALVPAKLDDLSRIVQKNQSIGTNLRETSSFLTEPKVYGRDEDRDRIIRKLTSDESAGQDLSILCIIGYGGVGKTTLANVVFNDSAVSKHFPVRLWVYVSAHFDQAKIIRKMLESLTGNKHEDIKSLKDLQRTLESEVKSKRVLLILDDIWEDSQKEKWDDLLTPLQSNGVKGNKILVTTRKPSVEKFMRANAKINLEGLDPDDFWHLFTECVFGNENYKVPPKLQKIGKEILVKLKGNPLAAKSLGKVLRRDHNPDFWATILDNNEWKHRTDDYDIMPALMISYKYLPEHLQQCFSYCSLFPKYHRYEKKCLVNIWIAQDLVSSTDVRLEEVGGQFFHDLVEWGFFQKEFEFGDLHIMHDLIHDLAQKVSSDDTYTIENSEHKEAPWLVRHVSVITAREYTSQVDGTVLLNEPFVQEFANSFGKLKQSKLSTFMLFGPLDLAIGNTIRQEFSEVNSVRVLTLEMAVFDLDLVIVNISAFVNLRYLELSCFYKGPRLELPEAICSLSHLQVLDIMKNWGDSTVLPRGMNKLGKLRHFIARDELHAKIAGVGKMVSLQELKTFCVRKASEFSIIQLKRLNQLRGSIRICNLKDVGSQEEAAEARICDKVHLTTLHLSWSGVNGQNVGFSSNCSILEDLQPHAGLVNLKIEAYRYPSPSWLSNNIHLTSLRSLHLDNCKKWCTIPEPKHLPLLRELNLRHMPRVREIVIGRLEILVLYYLPCLRRCAVLNEEQLSESLQVLEVENCDRLVEFPLPVLQDFQFTSLHRLVVHMYFCFRHTNIPQLLRMDSLKHVDLWLQPSCQEFQLRLGPSNALRMQIIGSHSQPVLRIEESLFGFDKLKNLVELEITTYPHLTYLPWEGLQHLTSLKRFKMIVCSKLFSNNVEFILPPSVEELEFHSCNITEQHLSQLLLNLPSLKKLVITNCEEVTSLPVGLFTDEHSQMPEGSWHIASNCLPSLERLQITFPEGSSVIAAMHFSNRKGFGRFVSLREVIIENCPTPLSTMVSGRASKVPPPSLVKLIVTDIEDSCLQFSQLSCLVELQVLRCSSLTSVNLDSCTALQDLKIEGCKLLSSIEGLQSCKTLRHLSIHGSEALLSLRASLSTLTTVSIEKNPNLACLDLHTCTALQKLRIEGCATMASFEGIKSLVGLKELRVENSPGFIRSWISAAAEVESEDSYFMGTLQVLDIDNISVLCMPICCQLTSLKTLTIDGARTVGVLTDDHEKALLLLTSLRHLELNNFKHLRSLPAEFQSLASLERFTLVNCERITSLPVGGLPASLKDMDLKGCSKELNASCIENYQARRLHLWVDGTAYE
ncbi:unnamed protein product [Triticum turgidum subsp. durum]|uniref:NB-ARC domain-containing protein n=1 Tax=Triticum turgidum subsp. durum TaxID=4567 RepID=A0A9R0Z4A4_TRITD|nr:unnamed protein product [Triticum turgidum subsp. durum]